MYRSFVYVALFIVLIGVGIHCTENVGDLRTNEKKFESVSLGMTEEDVVRIMGPPDDMEESFFGGQGKFVPPRGVGERDLWWRTLSFRTHALGVRIGRDNRVILAMKLVDRE